jgi:hypothetical protein
MPNYTVRHSDGYEWPLTVPNIPDRNKALDTFNQSDEARLAGIGPFVFDDGGTSPLPLDYRLIEISATGHETSYALAPLRVPSPPK